LAPNPNHTPHFFTHRNPSTINVDLNHVDLNHVDLNHQQFDGSRRMK
jgi:hypothetical protein